jgi:hypothetical protein
MFRASATLVACAFLLSDGAEVQLTMLTDTKARCLDGTFSGFYFQPATSSANSTKWVFVLDGGGECTTEAACTAALTSALGSSKYFPASRYSAGDFYDSDNAAGNPDLHDWNHVLVPYCSQDVHTGQVLTPSPKTYGLYFAGHHVYAAILDALVSSGGLGNATDIVLSGASAGGIGVWPNVDYTATRFPAARTVAAPVAGFYFYATFYTGINHTTSYLADFRPAAWPQHLALWQSYVNEDCAAALSATPWACLLANYSFPYVKSASFVVEAQTDQVVATSHDCIPQAYHQLAPEAAYLTQWAANMSIALRPVMDPRSTRNGGFSPACFIHTSFSATAPLIKGLNFLQAFGNWYFQRTPSSRYKLSDSCGLFCNPTCP